LAGQLRAEALMMFRSIVTLAALIGRRRAAVKKRAPLRAAVPRA
jgi:hypothetical protein